ncbi:site-specific integrase [Mesorhizobium sp. M1312]|uniref:tyrosine-type recombinase/integrase n=1 Tax=unclassified Mesorhizobium TaxID=325217 RepID=UPI00333BFD10
MSLSRLLSYGCGNCPHGLELKQRLNRYWYIEGSVTVWRNGRAVSKELRKSTKTRDGREADAIKRQIESAVAEQNITGREPAISFNAAADRYVKNGGEERFLDKPRAAFGRIRIDEITQELLDDEGVKAYPNTATRRRQFHGPVIAVLHGNGIRVQFDRPTDSAKRTYFLRPDQAVAAINRVIDSRTPNPWTPAFVTFLFGQGSRIGETLAIDGKNDISLSDRYAILRDPKNGKERMVNLCPRTIAALSAVPNIGRSGPLFLRYDGRPYTERTDPNAGRHFTWWSRAITEIDLDPELYTPHTARHSWATWFYSQTKDVVRLKAEGGWESDEWTRYVKLAVPKIGTDAMQLGFDFRQDGPEKALPQEQRA